MAALGIYLSMALWTRTVFIGPIVHTYFWLAVIFAALVVFLHRRKLELALPKRGRWIVPWMVLWWLWIVLLIFLYKAEGSRGHYRNLVFTVCLPLPVIILAARDFSEVRAFAITFIATTLIGGWFALSMEHITLEYLLGDPLLKDAGVKQLGIVSYHYFARGYALSLLLSLVLFFESRRRRLNLLFVACAALCIYFLFLVGSRQSLNGALVSGGLFVLWALLRVNLPRRQVLLVTAALAGIALYIYQTNPNLLLRADESDLSDTIDLLGNRGDLWQRGWDTFVASPLWGN
jgi:O-antigen ligase